MVLSDTEYNKNALLSIDDVLLITIDPLSGWRLGMFPQRQIYLDVAKLAANNS